MSEQEPKAPYIYQPYGMQHKINWSLGRIFGIAGVSLVTTIDGLTKEEAEKVLSALTNKGTPNDR